MSRFNLENYATVAERLAKFHKDYPDGRIVSTLIGSNDMGNGKTQWVVKTEIYLTAGDQANGLVKGTGFAAEIDGSGGANNTAALPNAETSSLGRALMAIGYAMNKDPKTLASREEMEKVTREDWLDKAATLETIEQLRDLYTLAKSSNAHPEVLERLKAYADRFTQGEATRASGGLSNSPIQGKRKGS
jgi:hypothetical protein